MKVPAPRGPGPRVPDALCLLRDSGGVRERAPLKRWSGKAGRSYTGPVSAETPCFRPLSVVLLAALLVALAAPAPAEAVDPQLILAIAATAGAAALIVGYLVVANGREAQRTGGLQGVYAACREAEATGPMGCGAAGSEPVAGAAAPSSTAEAAPMIVGSREAQRTTALRGVPAACPGSETPGPMGCSSRGPERVAAASVPFPASSAPENAPQGQ